MIARAYGVGESISMLTLCMRQHLGRRYYLIPWLVLVWPIYHIVLMLESDQVSFGPADAQNELIGLPVYLLAIGLGIRIIAGEIEHRTLEVVYTVPGGAKRIWLLKVAASAAIILCAELLLAAITWAVFTHYSPGALYRVFQGALFFLLLAMGAGAVLRSELAAAVVTATVLFALYPRLHDKRWSPLFDPLHANTLGADQISSWLLQNHIGMLLVIAMITALGFLAAERRERLLD